MLSGKWKSQFVIRTQPNNDSVSTLEAVAIAVAQFEKTPELIEVTFDRGYILYFDQHSSYFYFS